MLALSVGTFAVQAMTLAAYRFFSWICAASPSKRVTSASLVVTFFSSSAISLVREVMLALATSGSIVVARDAIISSKV